MTARVPWMTATAAPRQELADALPRSVAPARAAWLTPTAPAAVAAAAAPTPAPCPDCAEWRATRDRLAGLEDEAREVGRAAGLAEEAAARDLVGRAAAAMAATAAAGTAHLVELIVDVALAIAGELVPAAAAISPPELRALAAELIGGGGGGPVTLHLHAGDVARLADLASAEVRLVTDERLDPGELRVEAPRAVIDGSWPTRLAALRAPLLALVERELAPPSAAPAPEEP